jgi:hypothetical protein
MVCMAVLRFSRRWGRCGRRCRRGRAWWSSSWPPGQPLSSMRTPAPARTWVMVCMAVLLFSRWGRCGRRCRRGGASWSSSWPPGQPLSSMRTPAPARTWVWVRMVCLSCRGWCAGQPLGSTIEPWPARSAVLAFIASAHGVDHGSVARAKVRLGAHGSAPWRVVRRGRRRAVPVIETREGEALCRLWDEPRRASADGCGRGRTVGMVVGERGGRGGGWRALVSGG